MGSERDALLIKSEKNMKLTTFELAQRLLVTVANKATQCAVYNGWNGDFCKESITETIDSIKKDENFKPIDPNVFTVDELKKLGGCEWDEEFNNLILIPIWMLPFLADEFAAAGLDGVNQIYKREEIDNDCRFGCLAYGVFLAE